MALLLVPKLVTMFINHVKIAWRNLFRNKLHTAINTGGLVIGFTIGIAVLLVVYAQYSFDRFHANVDNLYQAYQVFNNPGGENIEKQFGLPAAPAYKSDAPSIIGATRFGEGGNRVEYNGKEVMIPVMLADRDFFSMFSFPVVKGNARDPLGALTDVVLNEETAVILFGHDEPVGKTIKAALGDHLLDLTVSAVVKSVPNSSIRFDVLTREENKPDYPEQKSNWNNRSQVMYLQLKPGATAQQAEQELKEVDKKWVPDWYRDQEAKGGRPDARGDLFATRLLPLKDVHFSTRVNGGHAAGTGQIFTLLTVGLLIIFIACFNFVNISLANGFSRGKEIGVRKCLGAARWKLFGQLWSESFLVCLLSFVLSLLLVNVLLHGLNGMEEVRNSLAPLLTRPGFITLSLGLLFFVSLLAGGYPSLVMMNFRVVETLKGNTRLKGGSLLRSSLIVAQFVIACIMISCTFIMYQQFRFLQHADIGINKDYLISIPLRKPERGAETIRQLRQRLASDPHILSITGSNINIGKGADHRTVKSSIGFSYQGHEISTNIASVDYDYLKTLGLRVTEGRDFDRAYATDTQNNVIISESMASQFHTRNLVGTYINGDSTGWRVIGIVPDFHLYSMGKKMEPLLLTMSHPALSYCFIRTAAADPAAAMERVKKEMDDLEHGQDFRGSFVEENVQNWYVEERVMSLSFCIAAVVAIFLSCSGLLAMVLLIIRQRVKEIGVRKVLGASVQSISVLISRNFLGLVGLAVLIATPLAWFVLQKWLESYPYRIRISPLVFLLVAATALLLSGVTIGLNTVRAARQNPVKSLRTE